MSVGIDISIDSLVSQFQSSLWTGKNNLFYGRIFRNERVVSFPEKISPEIWTSANDYIEVLKNSNYDAQCFFDVEPKMIINDGQSNVANVGICFMVDLYALYPSLTRTEATEQVHRDVYEFLELTRFDLVELVTGFAGFNGYDWGQENQSQVDLHPHYLFRFNTTLEYLLNEC